MSSVSADGCSFFYADDDFVEPWVPHDTVFLQPYIRGSHKQLQSWVPTLAREFRVIRMDRRGTGYSEKPPADYVYSMDGYLKDFVNVLDALGIERIHYVGDSFGSILGAALAAAHPDRVQSLVMSNPLLSVNSSVSGLWARGGYPDGPTAVTAMGSWAFSHSLWIELQAERVIDLLSKGAFSEVLELVGRAEQDALIPAHAMAAVMRLVTQPGFDISELLPKIQAPTLVLSPERSIATSEEQLKKIVEEIPDCELTFGDRGVSGFGWSSPEACAEICAAHVRKHAMTTGASRP